MSQITDEMIQRMQDAVEGECDGLAIDEQHARAIVEYVLAAQAVAMKPNMVGMIINTGGETISLPPKPAAVWYGGIPPIGTDLYASPPEPQDGWLPIATAPRDGTEILGFGSASWRGKKYAPAHHVAWFTDGKWLGRDPDADVELHLTEWTPLLAAPKRIARREGEQK